MQAPAWVPAFRGLDPVCTTRYPSTTTVFFVNLKLQGDTDGVIGIFRFAGKLRKPGALLDRGQQGILNPILANLEVYDQISLADDKQIFARTAGEDISTIVTREDITAGSGGDNIIALAAIDGKVEGR